ncbi:MAG: 8-oxoguanine deaminase [Kiloniellaceae bacterium]
MTAPARALWIKRPLAVFGPREAAGGVVVRGGKIAELVAADRTPETKDFDSFDAAQHVLLPGLINSHHHFYQTLTRACPPALDKPLFPWLKALYPIWAGLTPEAHRLATRLALAELALSGATTVSDHHYVFPENLEDAIDIQVEEAERLGLRAVFTRGSMSLSEDDGGLPPRRVVQREDAIMADSERLVARYHQAGPGAMIQIALAPCSPFSVTRDLMRAAAALAAEHDLRLHTHLAETRDEEDWCRAAFGCTPVDYLEDVGWLDGKTWLAHGIWFSDPEIQRLGKHRVGVCHCPSSNMILASGTCRVPALEAAGLQVGLGVDGSASNDGSDLLGEVRQAFLLQRLAQGAEKISHLDALRWATEGSAACLGRPDLGRLEAGAEADLTLCRLDALRHSGAGDPLAALVLCGGATADRVMVRGRWIVEDGALPGLDLDELRRHHRQAAQSLLS